MATKNPSIQPIVGYGERTHVVTWEHLANGDDGAPYEMPQSADRSIQVIGTFGSGGNLRIQGSNEAVPTTWATLTDPQGNALDFAAAKIELVSELTRWIRPAATAGDAATDLTVIMLARRT